MSEIEQFKKKLEAIEKKFELLDKAFADFIRTVDAGIEDARATLLSQQQSQPTAQPLKPVEEYFKMFPDQWRERLDLSVDGERKVLKVKPKTFLGRERFVELREIMKGLSGTYVSAGKDSRFEIPLVA